MYFSILFLSGITSGFAGPLTHGIAPEGPVRIVFSMLPEPEAATGSGVDSRKGGD